jgi:hypothetical protein
MNKPAAKEPSMDEILSSIRQIIADDDDAPAAETPPAEAAVPEPAPEPEPVAEPEPEPEVAEAPAPKAEEESADDAALELSAAQIVEDDGPDIAFDPAGPEPEPVVEEEPAAAAEEELDIPELVIPDDVEFNEPAPEPAVEEETVAAAAPMPDPDLSTDMAEQLLEPAADAAVKSTFAKLGNIGLGAKQLTIENMIREMLRPLLKEWLDENLPTLVETLVQKEIERLARGE